MNIQQLEYVIAVDNFRHFARAAEVCFVTQPTLSMMIQKLEDELAVKIFDRTKHPVEPTAIGKQIIEQAHISLRHFKQIKEIVENEQNIVTGSFKLGIIPTIASYLVPVLLQKHHADNNEIELTLKETTTHNMINDILKGTLNGGILAGPLHHPELSEYPLYYEKFYAYVSPQDASYQEKEIDLDKIDITDVWLLENEHCLRGQIERLCQLKKKSTTDDTSFVRYESGSIDTLINVVDYNPGITIIPEMHAMGLSEEKQENLRPFKNMMAVREVSLVVSNEYVRKTMLNKILDIIKDSVPKSMQNPELKAYVVDL
ncbi:MAG: hydrogen peroxide-inducible genes activator [Dysgonamonadaceae bacterium]|jgi:LysR family hydrogen peroxide-inducible transcriptional activator|nr:hydrogen peroxide-inducible genes activator [Dysgonamonadaceae bacterium]